MTPRSPKKDLPLRDDIRLLGRVLGDTIRDQEGKAMSDLVEQTPSVTRILFATALSERSCWTLGT